MKVTAANRKPAVRTETPVRIIKYQDLKDEIVGLPGTAEREAFEFELNLELIPLKIKEYRRRNHLTQAELGALLGVQKTQISKLETNAVNVTLETLLKVFRALHTKIKLSFEPEVVGQSARRAGVHPRGR